MNAGASKLRDSGVSLAKCVEALGKAGVTVTRKTVSVWRDGSRVPSDEARAVFAKAPFRIPVGSWEVAGGRRKASDPPPPPTAPAPPPSPPAASTSASDLAEDLLTRIQRWRLDAESTSTSPLAKKQLAELEMRAIAEFARFTGAATPETVLLKSPAWGRLKSRLLSALRAHPDALQAVEDALAGM